MEDRPSLLPERLSALPQRLSVVFKPRRARRVAARVGAALGLGTVFVVSAVAGVLLHLSTDVARRVTRRATNALLPAVLDGRIEVGEIEALSLGHARFKEVWIYDPTGQEVIYAEEVDARVSTMRLLRSIFWEDGPIRLTISRTRIERARVSFRTNASGIPTLADTFLPRDKSPSVGPPGRPFILRMPRIEIGEATAAGDVGVELDAGARKIKASVYVDTSDLVAVDVDHAFVTENALLRTPVSGAADYHMRFDLRSDRERALEYGPRVPDRLSMDADLSGSIGTIPASATATMIGLDLDARAVVPEATPQAVAGVLPAIPLTGPVSARLSASGPLPALTFDGSVEIPQGAGMGSVAVQGSLDFLDGVELRADVIAEEVDPRLFSRTIPESRLGGRARLDLIIPQGETEPRLALEVGTHAAEIGGHILPAMDATLWLHHGELIGSATVYEAGIPLDTRFTVRGEEVLYSVIGESADVAESPRVAPFLSGAGKLRVDGRWSGGRVEANARADLRGASTRVEPRLSALHTTVEASVKGPLDALEIDGSVGLTDLTMYDEELDKVVIVAKGPLLSPKVSLSVTDDNRGAIEASADVSVTERSVTGLTASVKRAGVDAKGKADRIAIGPGGPVVSGLAVTGTDLGDVHASISVQRGELVGKLAGRDVDLERVARLLGLPYAVEGVASFDVDVARSAAGRSGHIEVEIEGGKLFGLDGISTRVSAKLAGPELTTTGFVRLVDRASDDARADAGQKGLLGVATLCDGVVAEVRFADAQAKLNGPLLELASWAKAVGAADVVAEDWNLGCLAERLPARSNPFEEVAGVVTARGRIAQDEGDRQPSLQDFALATRGLVVVGKDAAFESRRLDVAAEGGFDGKTGTANLETVIRGSSFRAEIVAAAIVELRALLDPTTRDQTIREMPFQIDVTLPRRPISELAALPEPIGERIPALDGEVRLDLELWGTLTEPEMHVVAKGFGIASRAETALTAPILPPLDLALDSTFDPEKNLVTADLDVTLERRLVGSASTSVAMNPRLFVTGNGATPPWKADLFAQLFDFPLASLPILADRSVTGAVSGRLSLQGLHDQPSVEGALALRDVTIGDVALTGRIEASIKPREKGEIAEVDAGAIDAVDAARSFGDASLTVDLSQSDGGSIQVLAYAGADWEDLIVPAIDMGSAGGFALSAKRFRLTTLHPFVADIMTRLDGRVDGSVAVEWGKLGEAMQGRFADAKLDLSNVVVFIPQIGQELRQGRGAIRLAPATAGRPGQELKLERFEAKGTSGRVEGEASAYFKGLEFVEGSGNLVIKKGEELPITVEGVPIGKAHGDVAFTLAPNQAVMGDTGGRQFDVGVKLKRAFIQLPASSSRNVQSLDPAPGVQILQPIEAPRLSRSEKAIRWVVNVDIDDAAVQSAMLDTHLSTAVGSPIRLVLSDRLHAAGDISLTRGHVQLRARRFEIDQALVRLRDDDASNPYVNLTAHWDAPDGSRIFVDYIGVLSPITDDKIKFRSDPPRSQAEILAILIFGETDESGSSGTQTGLVGAVGSTVATSIAGDLVAAVFGGVIQDVAVNVGANEQGNYYGAQVSVSEDWRIGGQYEQLGGAETTGGTVGQRRGGCADLFADWSFARNWSLRGSTGYCSYEDDTNAGQSSQQFNLGIDVLWQYRY